MLTHSLELVLVGRINGRHCMDTLRHPLPRVSRVQTKASEKSFRGGLEGRRQSRVNDQDPVDGGNLLADGGIRGQLKEQPDHPALPGQLGGSETDG